MKLLLQLNPAKIHYTEVHVKRAVQP